MGENEKKMKELLDSWNVRYSYKQEKNKFLMHYLSDTVGEYTINIGFSAIDEKYKFQYFYLWVNDFCSSVSEEKYSQIIQYFNELNMGSYGTNLLLDKRNGSITVVLSCGICVPDEDNDMWSMVVTTIKEIDKLYPRIMKIVWA